MTVTPQGDKTSEHYRHRLEILDGILRAYDLAPQILAVILAAPTTRSARDSLRAPPFDFTETQSELVLEMPFRQLTAEGRADAAARREALVRNGVTEPPSNRAFGSAGGRAE